MTLSLPGKALVKTNEQTNKKLYKTSVKKERRFRLNNMSAGQLKKYKVIFGNPRAVVNLFGVLSLFTNRVHIEQHTEAH